MPEETVEWSIATKNEKGFVASNGRYAKRSEAVEFIEKLRQNTGIKKIWLRKHVTLITIDEEWTLNEKSK